MTLRGAAKTLLVLSLALPILQAVLYWVGGLLLAMDDSSGATVVVHVSTILRILWSVSLVGLVIVLALVVLADSPPDE